MYRLGLISICICLTSCFKAPQEPKGYAFPVRIGKSLGKSAPLFIEALGHVESIDRVEIRSRVEGELTGIFFTQGQEVKKGDLLFTIDARGYEAIVESAKGALMEASATLLLAEEKVKRYKTLTQMDFYSQIDYETLQCNWERAKGDALLNQGRLDKANVDLQYCWIYAPIDGLVGIQQIDLGNLVATGGETPLVVINQIAPIYVTFSIPEAKLPLIQKRYCQKERIAVFVAYENFEKQVFAGELFMVDNQVNEKTGTIKLRALLPNTERELWPGQFVRTRLLYAVQENAVIIPYSGVQFTDKEPIAFVVTEEKKVEQRKIQLGQRLDGSVIVLEGIEPNETVVIEGQLNLFDGARVEIVE